VQITKAQAFKIMSRSPERFERRSVSKPTCIRYPRVVNPRTYSGSGAAAVDDLVRDDQ
jgi:hypothetical protein